MSSSSVETAQDVSNYILQMVENYSEVQLRKELPSFEGWRQNLPRARVQSSQTQQQQPQQHYHDDVVVAAAADDDDVQDVKAKNGVSTRSMRKKTMYGSDSDLFVQLLDSTVILDFLEWREVCQLRGVSRLVKGVVYTLVECFVVDYFRPTVDVKEAVDTILKNGGGWSRFVVMVLANLMDKIERHCQPLGLVPPLLYRVFLSRWLVHELGYSRTEEPIRRTFDSSDSTIEWKSVETTTTVTTTWIENENNLTGCPSLMSIPRYHGGVPLIPFTTEDSDDDDDDDSEDDEGERKAFQNLWNRSLPLFDLSDDYTSFAMVATAMNETSSANHN